MQLYVIFDVKLSPFQLVFTGEEILSLTITKSESYY